MTWRAKTMGAWLVAAAVVGLGLGCGGDGGSGAFTALDDAGHNPVIETVELADPHVIRHDGRYYLYATDGSGDDAYLGYDVYLSDDVVHWRQGPRVFEHPGPNVWAPDVWFDPQTRRFHLYYSSDSRIGVAVADDPEGPFEDRGILIDEAIDAHLFRDDDGSLYLYYSRAKPVVELLLADGLRGSLMVQRMRSPLELDGTVPVELLRAEGWEVYLGLIGIVEGPWMLKRGGLYYLMYSGNVTSGIDYAVGYATSSSPTGPFTRFEGNPVLSRREGVLGPGHHSVVRAPDGSLVIAYHQKTTSRFTAFEFGDRVICMDHMGFDGSGRIWTTPTALHPR